MVAWVDRKWCSKFCGPTSAALLLNLLNHNLCIIIHWAIYLINTFDSPESNPILCPTGTENDIPYSSSIFATMHSETSAPIGCDTSYNDVGCINTVSDDVSAAILSFYRQRSLTNRNRICWSFKNLSRWINTSLTWSYDTCVQHNK